MFAITQAWLEKAFVTRQGERILSHACMDHTTPHSPLRYLPEMQHGVAKAGGEEHNEDDIAAADEIARCSTQKQ